MVFVVSISSSFKSINSFIICLSSTIAHSYAHNYKPIPNSMIVHG